PRPNRLNNLHQCIPESPPMRRHQLLSKLFRRLPLIAFDYQAMTTFAAGSPAPQEVRQRFRTFQVSPRTCQAVRRHADQAAPSPRRGPAPAPFRAPRGHPTATLAAAKGRLILCTVPGSTPNCLAMTRTGASRIVSPVATTPLERSAIDEV